MPTSRARGARSKLGQTRARAPGTHQDEAAALAAVERGLDLLRHAVLHLCHEHEDLPQRQPAQRPVGQEARAAHGGAAHNAPSAPARSASVMRVARSRWARAARRVHSTCLPPRPALHRTRARRAQRRAQHTRRAARARARQPRRHQALPPGRHRPARRPGPFTRGGVGVRRALTCCASPHPICAASRCSRRQWLRAEVYSSDFVGKVRGWNVRGLTAEKLRREATASVSCIAVGAGRHCPRQQWWRRRARRRGRPRGMRWRRRARLQPGHLERAMA